MPQAAIIYARFSSLEQSKGYSLERQTTHGRQFAEAKGWHVEEVLTDEGRSAFHGANRVEGSALNRFEIEAREGQHRGKVLCVENIDRLSRQGAKAAAQLIWALNEAGVDVATWHDGYTYRAGSDGDMMELFSVIIKAQLAYEESFKKSERTKASWSKRYADIGEGKKRTVAGAVPAWIVRDGDGYKLDEYRTKVLNEIYDLYISGIGTYLIVQKLNERKEAPWTVRSRDGKAGWYLAYVHRLLTRRAVLGEYITVKGEVVSADFYPAAVTVEKFNRAQAVRAGKRSTGGGNRIRVNNLLGGMVRCSKCDGTGVYENKGANSFTRYTTSTGQERLYKRKLYQGLRCDNTRRKHGCDNKALFEYAIVERTVLDLVLGMAVDEDSTSPALLAVNERVADAQRLLDHSSTRLDNLVEAIADGGSKALVARVVTLEEEVAQRKEALAQLVRERDQLSSKPKTADDTALIASLREDLNSEDTDVRHYARSKTNLALKRVIEQIMLNEDNTFTVWSDMAIWHFDQFGNYLTGQAI